MDFYCHRADLVVEVDGPIHRGQQEADQRREDVLKSKGLRVTRFMNEEVEPNLEGVCGGILDPLGEIS